MILGNAADRLSVLYQGRENVPHHATDFEITNGWNKAYTTLREKHMAPDSPKR